MQTESTLFTVKRRFFVVETSMERRPHHGLHTNTSKHVLTEVPKGGDKVIDCIEVDQGCVVKNESLMVMMGKISLNSGYRFGLGSHAGRQAMLGEDNFEHGTDDLLFQLIGEKLLGTRSWDYAPCELTIQRHSGEGTDLERWYYFSVSEDRQSLVAAELFDGPRPMPVGFQQ